MDNVGIYFRERIGRAIESALVAACTVLRDVEDAPCTDPDRPGYRCGTCVGALLAGDMWRLTHGEQLPAEVLRALHQSRGGAWPEVFLADWQWWAGRLGSAYATRP